MNSIINEILQIRQATPLLIDHQNTNRYRVVSNETDGSKTAYYFTSPIYNINTRKAVDLKFHSQNNIIFATGSNANITISSKIRMENSEGYALISLQNHINNFSENEIFCGNEYIYPTTNGIAIKSRCSTSPSTFSFEVNKLFSDIRANDKSFALMSERFKPFAVISCIGCLDEQNNIVAPAKLSYKQIDNRKYEISIVPCSSHAEYILFEANLYEHKLFQDTTVESTNPKTNNAFGSIGFIGATEAFGEQWLYSRPDFSKMSEMNNQRINSALLYIPKNSTNNINLMATKTSTRFCSFGSTWDNKVTESSHISDLSVNDHYMCLDLTSLVVDRYGRLIKGDGFILKPSKKDSGCTIISTGDSSLYPQIFVINYR